MSPEFAAAITCMVVGALVLAGIVVPWGWREWSPWRVQVVLLRALARHHGLECPRERFERFSSWEKRVTERVAEVEESRAAFFDAVEREGKVYWVGPQVGYLRGIPESHPAAVRFNSARGMTVPKKYLN